MQKQCDTRGPVSGRGGGAGIGRAGWGCAGVCGFDSPGEEFVGDGGEIDFDGEFVAEGEEEFSQVDGLVRVGGEFFFEAGGGCAQEGGAVGVVFEGAGEGVVEGGAAGGGAALGGRGAGGEAGLEATQARATAAKRVNRMAGSVGL